MGGCGVISHHRREPGPDLLPLFAQRELLEPVPRDRLPAGTMTAAAAEQIVRELLELDGTPALNLASFVSTWMEPEAERLLADSLSKNFIDQEEYPRTSEIERRCVSILADLFHAGLDGDRKSVV